MRLTLTVALAVWGGVTEPETVRGGVCDGDGCDVDVPVAVPLAELDGDAPSESVADGLDVGVAVVVGVNVGVVVGGAYAYRKLQSKDKSTECCLKERCRASDCSNSVDLCSPIIDWCVYTHQDNIRICRRDGGEHCDGLIAAIRATCAIRNLAGERVPASRAACANKEVRHDTRRGRAARVDR